MDLSQRKELADKVRDADDLLEATEKPFWARLRMAIAEELASDKLNYETCDPVGSVEQAVRDLQSLWVLRGTNKGIGKLDSAIQTIKDEGEKARDALAARRSG